MHNTPWNDALSPSSAFCIVIRLAHLPEIMPYHLLLHSVLFVDWLIFLALAARPEITADNWLFQDIHEVLFDSIHLRNSKEEVNGFSFHFICDVYFWCHDICCNFLMKLKISWCWIPCIFIILLWLKWACTWFKWLVRKAFFLCWWDSSNPCHSLLSAFAECSLC